MTIKQYFYKFGELPVQNIGTGDVVRQEEIEEFIKKYETEQFYDSSKRKVIVLSEYFDFVSNDLKLGGEKI